MSLSKKFLLPLLLVILSLDLAGQLKFEKLNYDEALAKAKKKGKLIFLQFESDGCTQCNEVADKAFQDKTLSEQLEQSFTCIKIGLDHPDREKIAGLFNKQDDNFGSLFIGPDGNLFHSYPGSTTLIKTYQDHIDKALTKAGEGIRVNQMEKEFVEGNRNIDFMENLLVAKKAIGLETDNMLEEYVKLLPADSFKSVRTIVFIATLTPFVDSKSQSKILENRTLFNKAWFSIPLNTRTSINLRISYKSMQKAIKEKDLAYAIRVAGFTSSTVNNKEEASKAFDYKMMEYYREVKDTSSFFNLAGRYYDKYFMTITVDSILKKDSINLRALFDKQPPPSPSETGLARQTVRYAKLGQFFNRELNAGAVAYIKLTDDPARLNQALAWSTHANEFFDHDISMKTQALLLYKLGRIDEALEWQSKAIVIKKKRGFDTKALEKELEDMKKGKL